MVIKISEIAKMPEKKPLCELFPNGDIRPMKGAENIGYNFGIDDCSNIEVEADARKLAEILFGMEFYEGLSPVIENQYIIRAQKIIKLMPQWIVK